MSEHTPTTYAVKTNYAMTMLRVGRKDVDPYSAFDRWLAEHDREVAAKAWEEGAIAAWNRSGKQVFGESYEELDFIPLSLRETNPYEQKGAGK